MDAFRCPACGAYCITAGHIRICPCGWCEAPEYLTYCARCDAINARYEDELQAYVPRECSRLGLDYDALLELHGFLEFVDEYLTAEYPGHYAPMEEAVKHPGYPEHVPIPDEIAERYRVILTRDGIPTDWAD
jgi:hypothetical protein